MAIPPSLPHASYYYRGAAGLGSGGNQNAVSQLSKAPGAGANAYTSEATRSSWAYRLAIQNNASAQDAKDNGEEIAVDEAGATSAMDAKVKLMRLGSVSGGNLAITAAAAEDRRASPLGDEGSDDAEGDYDEDDNEGSGEAVVYHERRGYGTQGSRDSDVPTASSVTATGAGGLRSTRIDDDGNP